MREEKLNYDRMLILCKMFMKETSNLKVLISNLCEEFTAVSESMYYMTKRQDEILNVLLNNFELEDMNFDCSPSFYHFIKYKRRR